MQRIREKKCECRNGYTEVGIYHNSGDNIHTLPRAERKRLTVPKQKKLNDENSRRAMRLLINENFEEGDYHISPTYNSESLPCDNKAAIKALRCYIRKLRALYKKNGYELKYLYVTENGGKNGRVHHHIIVNNVGISRDVLENLWVHGFVNAGRLQHDSDGTFNELANYLHKSAANAEKHSRVWNCSRNLRRPIERTSDNEISKKQLAALVEAKRNDELKSVVERIYKGYSMIEAYVSTNEVTGLPYVHLRLMRKSKMKTKQYSSGADKHKSIRCDIGTYSYNRASKSALQSVANINSFFTSNE